MSFGHEDMKKTEHDLNPQIVAWLEEGKTHEALLSRGDFFIRDHTYRSDHAITLVMYVLLHWAEQNQNIPAVSHSLSELCRLLHDADDLTSLRDVVLAYDVVSRDERIILDFPLDEWHDRLPHELKWKRDRTTTSTGISQPARGL